MSEYEGKGCSPLGMVTWFANPLMSGDRQVRYVAQAIIDDMDEYVASNVCGQDDILDLPTDLVYIGRQTCSIKSEGSCHTLVEWTFGSNYEDGIDVLVYQEPGVLGLGRWLIRTPFGGDRPINFGQAMRIAVDFHVIFVTHGYLP